VEMKDDGRVFPDPDFPPDRILHEEAEPVFGRGQVMELEKYLQQSYG